jgi:hypothetical protein
MCIFEGNSFVVINEKKFESWSGLLMKTIWLSFKKSKNSEPMVLKKLKGLKCYSKNEN